MAMMQTKKIDPATVRPADAAAVDTEMIVCKGVEFVADVRVGPEAD